MTDPPERGFCQTKSAMIRSSREDGWKQRGDVGFKNNYFAETASSSEEGSYLGLVDLCITQLQAREFSRRREVHKRPFVGVSQGTVWGFGDHFAGNSRQKLTNLSIIDF